MGVATGSIGVLTDAIKMASDGLKTAVTIGANVGKASLNATHLLVKATTSLDMTFSNVAKEFVGGIKDFNKIQIRSAALNREANEILGSMGDDFKNLPGDMLSNLAAPLDLFALNVRTMGPHFLKLHNRLRITGANTAENTEALYRMSVLSGRGNAGMDHSVGRQVRSSSAKANQAFTVVYRCHAKVAIANRGRSIPKTTSWNHEGN